MVNKMPSTAKFCKKMKRKVKKINVEAENLKIKKKFLKLEGYRIEVSENSFILFENEEDYMNIFYLEKVIFDFINNLLFNKDKDKDVRVYFRLSLIEKYLKSLPKFRKIKIFYEYRKCEDPFRTKFRFISSFENYSKRKKYYKKLLDLHRTYKDDVDYDDFYDDFYEGRCRHYEGRCLLKIFCKAINILYNRIDIKYYKRNQDIFLHYNTDKSYHMTYFPYLIKFYKSDTDTDINTDMERNMEMDTLAISDYSD